MNTFSSSSSSKTASDAVLVSSSSSSCRSITSIFMVALLLFSFQTAHGFVASPPKTRSHHHHDSSSMKRAITYDKTTTRRTISASAVSWSLRAVRRSPRQAKGGGGGGGASSSSSFWRMKNHTDLQSSWSPSDRSAAAKAASTPTAPAASSTIRSTTSATTTTRTKTTTELMVHDLLRQHYEYTSDFSSLRHDMIKDATSAASAVAAVAMTTTTTSSSSHHHASSSDRAVQHQQQETKDTAIFWARLLLIGAAALYGTNFSLVKLLMGSESTTDIPVGLSTALRFGLAAMVTSPWLFMMPPRKAALAETATTMTTTIVEEEEEQRDRAAALDATWLGLQVGICNSIGYMAQSVGLAGTTEAGKSAFICSLAVVVVPFLDYITGRALSQREWMGAALALAGVALLELGDGLFLGSSAAAGDIASTASGAVGIGMDDWISLLQPLAFGMGFFLMEQAMRKVPQHASRSTAAQLLAVFIASTLYCAVMESDTFFSTTFWMETVIPWLHDPHTLLFLLWTGCISTALSIYMETVALKTLSAAETTLILSTEPLWGAAFAAMIIGEQFGINSAMGGILIMAGCLYSSNLVGVNLGFFESFLSNMISQQQDNSTTSVLKSHTFQPSVKMHTKRKELEHYMAASMVSSPSSSPLLGKRQKQQQPQRHKGENSSNIPQLSALAVAIAAGVMVAEPHLSDASRVLSHQVGNFVDGIMQ